MNKSLIRLFGVGIAAVAVAFFVGISTNTAVAQTYYGAYTPQTQQALIAQLYALIAQLQNQSTANYVQPQYYYQPAAVLNYNTFSNIEVETSGVNNIDGDKAWAFGQVDLNDAVFATVWFEYGRNTSLGRRSAVGEINSRTSENFRADLVNLDRDQKYYFRAVAQDPAGRRTYGGIQSFFSDNNSSRNSRNNNDDEPDAETNSARNITQTSATLRGEVDMNDFKNGLVFFVYGEDEDQVEDVEDEDEFRDIDEDGDDLQKLLVDRDLDNDEEYERKVTGLDRDTDIFFRICVEFEDEDDEETIICGEVEEFETDR